MSGYKLPAPIMVLKSKVSNLTKSIYLLNPGETFPGFGGTSGGLTVRKTASLIIRDQDVWGTKDLELNLADADMWAFIRRIIREERMTIQPQPEDAQEAA